MKIGRSGVYLCDFCGETIVGEPDMCRRSGKELHFCEPDGCIDQYHYENYYREMVADQVEAEREAEFKLIHDQVCPACRFRLRALL